MAYPVQGALPMTDATQTKADQIDNYIAREYLAQRRGEDTGSFTGRLLAMAEEARMFGAKGQKILQKAARDMAEWELDNQ